MDLARYEVLDRLAVEGHRRAHDLPTRAAEQRRARQRRSCVTSCQSGPPRTARQLEHLLGFPGFTHDEVTGRHRRDVRAAAGDEQPSWEACVRGSRRCRSRLLRARLRVRPVAPRRRGRDGAPRARPPAHSRRVGRGRSRRRCSRPRASGRPDFCGVTADFPAGFPWFGAWYTGGVEKRFPDFSAGLCMSGRDLRRFQHELLFNEPDLANFTRDRTRAYCGVPPRRLGRGRPQLARHLAPRRRVARVRRGRGRALGGPRARGRAVRRRRARVVHSFGIWAAMRGSISPTDTTAYSCTRGRSTCNMFGSA